MCVEILFQKKTPLWPLTISIRIWILSFHSDEQRRKNSWSSSTEGICFLTSVHQSYRVVQYSAHEEQHVPGSNGALAEWSFSWWWRQRYFTFSPHNCWFAMQDKTCRRASGFLNSFFLFLQLVISPACLVFSPLVASPLHQELASCLITSGKSLQVHGYGQLIWSQVPERMINLKAKSRLWLNCACLLNWGVLFLFTANENSSPWVKARATQYSLLTTSIFAILLSIFNLFREEWGIYLTFVTEIFFLPCLYGTAIGFIALVWVSRKWCFILWLSFFRPLFLYPLSFSFENWCANMRKRAQRVHKRRRTLRFSSVLQVSHFTFWQTSGNNDAGWFCRPVCASTHAAMGWKWQFHISKLHTFSVSQEKANQNQPPIPCHSFSTIHFHFPYRCWFLRWSRRLWPCTIQC